MRKNDTYSDTKNYIRERKLGNKLKPEFPNCTWSAIAISLLTWKWIGKSHPVWNGHLIWNKAIARLLSGAAIRKGLELKEELGKIIQERYFLHSLFCNEFVTR